MREETGNCMLLGCLICFGVAFRALTWLSDVCIA